MLERSGTGLFILLSVLQLVLGLWRARITQSSVAPSLALVAVIAAVGALWLVRRREWPGAFLANPAALLLTTIGALSAVSALNAPLIPLIARVSTPFFALSAAGVLAAARVEPRNQIAPLSAFALAVVLLEVALMTDARWQAGLS